VFVESVLRYGLPVNFQAMLLHPHKKSTKRLRDVLNQMYGHLDSSALQGSAKGQEVCCLGLIVCSINFIFSFHFQTVDIPGLGFGQSEYFAYVYYKINIDMVDQKPI
jgi:V-type H+-transporting ATPase subunit C